MKQLKKFEPYLQLGHTVPGNKPFVLSGIDFERHKLISGITGSGKSYFICSLLLYLFRMGFTVILLDPNGDLATLFMTLLAASDFYSDPRAYQKLWYVDFKRAEKDAAIALNILSQPYEMHTVANNLLEAMHRAFPVSTTTTSLDNVILAASLVLIENNKPITDLPRLILDQHFREALLRNVTDDMVVQFFKSKFGEKVNSNLVDSTMRRSFLLTFSPVLRNTFGQVENKLNFRQLFDGTSCILNLGGLDDTTKRLLGGALLVSIEQAFLSRADIEPENRRPVHVFVDEFPVFASQSEQSFAVILEQVRKYKGTLYLAHQTQSQLSSGMAGSLQNAVSINMRAGYEDSSKLVQHFYRQPQVEQESLFDSFLALFGAHEQKPHSIFSGVPDTNQAKYLYETLERQMALVSLNGITTLIKTNTIPSVAVDRPRLQEIEDTYAHVLLTPLGDIGKKHAAPLRAVKTIARRTYTSAAKQVAFTIQSGDLEQDIQTALEHFHFASIDHLLLLLGKKEGNKNYLRKKLTSMVDDGVLSVTALPRTTGGKPLQVYSLSSTAERKHQFLEHTLDCNDVLLAGLQVPIIQPSLTLVDLKHERTLKNMLSSSPCIPDGLLTYQTQTGELIHIACEIDRSTENNKRITQKYLSYPDFIQHMGIDALTIAFVITINERNRLNALVELAKDTLGTSGIANLLLFAVVDGTGISPALFTKSICIGLDNAPHSLIEQPF